MAADDFFESEVALAAAATAVAFSPRVRGIIRQGLVYGVAGVTVAARTVAGAAEAVGRGVADALPIGNRSSANGSTRATTVSAPAARAPAARAARAAKATAAGATSGAAAARPRAAKRPAATRARAAAGKAAATPDPAAPAGATS